LSIERERAWYRDVMAGRLGGVVWGEDGDAALTGPADAEAWVREREAAAAFTATAAGYPWPEMRLSLSRLLAAHRASVGHVAYSWGAKPSGALLPGMLHRADCSGYVGWLLYRATGGQTDWTGRGTWHLRRFLEAGGYKASSPALAGLEDGALRVAVTVSVPGFPVGHVALVYQGETLECAGGGRGVCSRPWVPDGWQRRARVFVLARANALGP